MSPMGSNEQFTVSEKEFNKYNVAIHKAVNKDETPVKQKHVRSAIIGTFNQQGAQLFWSIAVRLPCLDDPIIAWKFCYVLHKIMREGHPACIEDSHRHTHYVEDIGKLWGHLEGYGKLIRIYTNLLVMKLNFHLRNPRFPGNMNVATNDLMSICNRNADVCFQLSVELFDYLDTILELQQRIFKYSSSSMTTQGQCRLAPIIPCVQDASRIYDHNVKILFFLHDIVDYDLLEGHRDRFYKQYNQLKLFYQNTNKMHYFRNLITVPPLPEHPPNFQAKLNSYVTQEVSVLPEEEEEPRQLAPVEGDLIDTTDAAQLLAQPQPNHIHIPPPVIEPAEPTITVQTHLDVISERDAIIKTLQKDCEQLRFEINDLCQKGQDEKTKLVEQISALETNLAAKDSLLLHEREVNEAVLQTQAEYEEHKNKEDKFKVNYIKLREEHIGLLREKGKLDKVLKSTEEKIVTYEKEKEVLETKLKETEVQHEQSVQDLLKVDGDKSAQLLTLQSSVDSFKLEKENLQQELETLRKEKDTTLEELQSWLSKNQELSQRINVLVANVSQLDGEITNLKEDNKVTLENLIVKAIENHERIMREGIEEVDNPALCAVVGNTEYLRTLTETCRESLKSSSGLSRNDPIALINTTSRLVHLNAMYMIQGRAVSNTSPDIFFGEKMAESCKVYGERVINLLECLKDDKPSDEALKVCLNQLDELVSLGETISGSVQGETAENLEGMLESELALMDKAIDEAAKKMQEMLSKSREADTGIKLQVNERILDSCTTLMQAIRILVQRSKALQNEIVLQGKGNSTTKEFYKRNSSKWTDGFISAAKSIAVAANFLLESADKAVGGEGKLEHLVVAAHEISASTTQLLISCRVKADRKSTNLDQVVQASKGVTGATGTIVATVKDCSQLIEESTEMDTSNMTLHQAKRMEMESQVRVLELEKALDQERVKLSTLRKHHYQLAGESEGWEKQEPK